MAKPVELFSAWLSWMAETVLAFLGDASGAVGKTPLQDLARLGGSASALLRGRSMKRVARRPSFGSSPPDTGHAANVGDASRSEVGEQGPEPVSVSKLGKTGSGCPQGQSPRRTPRRIHSLCQLQIRALSTRIGSSPTLSRAKLRAVVSHPGSKTHTHSHLALSPGFSLQDRYIVSVRGRTQEELRADVTWSGKRAEHWCPEASDVFMLIEEPLNGENVARCVRNEGLWAIYKEVCRARDFFASAPLDEEGLPPFKAGAGTGGMRRREPPSWREGSNSPQKQDRSGLPETRTHAHMPRKYRVAAQS